MIFFRIIILVFFTTSVTFAQCDLRKLELSIHHNQNFGELIQLFKWSPSNKNQVNQYQLNLVAGKRYTITLASWGGNTNQKFKAELFDNNQHRKGSTYYNKKFYSTLTYNCRKTGIYTLKFDYQDAISFCGVAIFGMEN